MRVALLTIGSEITSGEIVNTNSVWMSEQLESLGFTVAAQLSVPDAPELIQWAFDSLVFGGCDVLFVSGGLGPTSDDITRQELAKWCGASLVFNDEVFSRLSALLTSRGVPVREGHKQQCYFQDGAELLANTTGTALGFYVRHLVQQNLVDSRLQFVDSGIVNRSGDRASAEGRADKVIVKDRGNKGDDVNLSAKSVSIFVLPGPPRELEPMWLNEVLPRISKLPRNRDFGIRRWVLNGVPESEAAEVVEEVMKGCDVVLGYRASKPIVRVKVRYRLSDSAALKKIDELDTLLAKWVKVNPA